MILAGTIGTGVVVGSYALGRLASRRRVRRPLLVLSRERVRPARVAGSLAMLFARRLLTGVASLVAAEIMRRGVPQAIARQMRHSQ